MGDEINHHMNAGGLVMDKTDMLVEILSHLDLDDLRRCASVCHTWRGVLHDVWGSLWQRCLRWETEESFLETDLTSSSSSQQLRAGETEQFKWEPTRSFTHVTWGQGTTVLDLARDSNLRQRVRMEAKQPEGSEEAVRTSPLREHVWAIDSSLNAWISALERTKASGHPQLTTDAEKIPNEELLFLSSEAELASFSTFCQLGSVDGGPRPTDSDPLGSPRALFPVSFVCAASERLPQCPPPPRGKHLLPDFSTGRSQPPGPRPVRRSLTFESPEGSVSNAAGNQRSARVSAKAAAKFKAPAAAMGKGAPSPSVVLHPALPRRLLATASVRNPVGLPNTRHREAGSNVPAVRQLQDFAKCHSVTKFVDLLGTDNKLSSGGRDPSVYGFVQKVVSQVKYNSAEVRIVQTFGWQRSSAQWLSLRDGQEGPVAPEEQLAGRWAGAGDVVITQLEHRYCATLTVAFREVEHGRPEAEWQEILQMSQKTDLNFSPDETLWLQRPQLEALRMAWGLTSIGDELLLRMLVMLGGRQPQHMSSMLEHLFRTLDSREPYAGVHLHQEEGSPAQFCNLCSAKCLGAKLMGGLPKLWCMTDPSLVEDISWVIALASD